MEAEMKVNFYEKINTLIPRKKRDNFFLYKYRKEETHFTQITGKGIKTFV